MFLPYKDDNPRVMIPYVTYALVGINIFVFFVEILITPELRVNLIKFYGIVPKLTSIDFGHYVITLFTSMFLHGGFMHLFGNMLYLWIFADNVESILGHTKFIIFYLTCGIAAGLLQTVIEPTSVVPIVGASGAIAGVLGAYMITFPRARVHTIIFIIFYFTIVRIPALYVLGFWLLIQLTNGLGTLGINTTGGVAWFAHIGGFTTGVALIRGLKMIQIVRR
ncbi:MAG: rhomboid family intramembrane serine protease [Candidatus Marinimicrobia bacterium]|nr:rhomboid family intramembrane serine protease [Candidatus Neomarinimicrobiota bacterium]MBL7046994.1 rhomboid family intramembrane serine protease [Candidatus Neomarinimicrobiota bacterium]